MYDGGLVEIGMRKVIFFFCMCGVVTVPEHSDACKRHKIHIWVGLPHYKGYSLCLFCTIVASTSVGSVRAVCAVTRLCV